MSKHLNNAIFSNKSMNGYIDKLEATIAKGIAITDEYVAPEKIDILAKRLPNQPVLYRHVHPASPGQGDVFGTVTRAEVIEHDGHKKLYFEAKLADYTQMQRKLIDYIKEKEQSGDPVGVSLGFVDYGNDVFPFDLSITRIPVVEESGIVIEMEDKEKLKKLEEALDLIKQKDEELKRVLNEKAEIEKNLEAVKVELEQAKSIASAKEEDLRKAVEAQIAELEQKYTKRIEMLEKAPIIDKIFEIEGDEWHKDHTYPDMPLDALKERLNILMERKKVIGNAAKKIVVNEEEHEELPSKDLIDKIVKEAVAPFKGGVA